MRDVAFTLVFFFAAIPGVVRPWIGLALWVWMDYMNPHRLCYSFAKYLIPFSAIASGLTIISILFSSAPKRFPITRETVLLILFIGWMFITTTLALNPEGAAVEWDRAFKIQVLILVTLIVAYDRFRIEALVWVIAGSLAFYGLKGGLSTLINGGHYRIYGPEFTFIEDNNDLALSLVATIPLLRYLMLRTANKYIRFGFGISIFLLATSVLGSYSRGGFVGLVVVTILMILKSRKPLFFGAAMIAGTLLVMQFMPQEWFDRMNTIKTYNNDTSVLGRFNAWQFGWNLTLDHPITGGGFKCFNKQLFQKYAPDPEDFHEAHNIFIKIMTEHGFVGITLFLSMATFAWLSASWVRRNTRGDDALTWAGDLAGLVQVSMAGYAVGGFFLNLAYFDLPYHLIVIIVLTKEVVKWEFYQRSLEPEATHEESSPETAELAYS